MKIVFILPGRGRSGGVRCTVISANHLLDRGHKVRILYHKTHATPKILIREMVKKLSYNKRYDWLGISRSRISGYRDITKCVFYSDEIIVGVGMLCSAQLDKAGATNNPKLQYIHGLTPWMPEVMDEALSLPLPKVAVSSQVAEKIKSYNSGDLLAIIHNGIDRTEYYPSLNEGKRDGVGTIYSDHPAKDPQTLLWVVAKLMKDIPCVPQYIFGTSRRPKQIPAACYKWYPSVEEARCRYSRSKVWILSSRSEGFPGPVLEAMACGCAVVATDCGGTLDIIQDGENGFLVEVGNVDQIVDRVKLLLNDHKLRQRMVEKSKNTVNKFNWESSVDKLEAVLKSIANANL